tara:strand:- start:460 stop:894 length:435 start_codon:yes stop_codon:yes gene_type:complete
MKSKGAVAKALKDKGIPLPEEDSFDAMMHRLNSWDAARGYLFRRIKSRFYSQQKLPVEIPMGVVVFVPASQFARQIMKTGAMFPLGRAEYDSDKHVLIDVPKTESFEEPKVEKAKPKKTTAPKKSSSEKVKKSDNNKSNSKSNS